MIAKVANGLHLEPDAQAGAVRLLGGGRARAAVASCGGRQLPEALGDRLHQVCGSCNRDCAELRRLRLVGRIGAVSAFVVGCGLGLFVAAQIGPVSLLIVRSVLRGSLRIGLAMGAAVALVDLLYASLGLAGAGRLVDAADGARVAVGLLGVRSSSFSAHALSGVGSGRASASRRTPRSRHLAARLPQRSPRRPSTR